MVTQSIALAINFIPAAVNFHCFRLVPLKLRNLRRKITKAADIPTIKNIVKLRLQPILFVGQNLVLALQFAKSVVAP